MKKLLIILTLLTLILPVATTNPLNVIELTQGKNIFFINESFPSFKASSLTSSYPVIQSISTEEYGETVGFVNIFGGIGNDFFVQPGKAYEIYSKEDVTIYLND